ncbi:MAG: hypothetical protein ACI857_002285 [Arenicella sp.]|jgi:hypothetical protein
MRLLLFLIASFTFYPSFSQGTLSEENSVVFQDTLFDWWMIYGMDAEKSRVMTDSETEKANELLNKCITTVSQQNEYNDMFFAKYYFQLFPHINRAGEKMVWVNAIDKDFIAARDDEEEWKTDFYPVPAYKNSFWNVNLNIEKDHYLNFEINL